MTSTIFDVQCSENFRNINVGINNNNSELQVYHKNSGIVYKTKVNIWNPLLRYDSWISYYFSNDIIVITDYDGIFVYDNKLKLKYNHKIELNNRYNYVYGFKAVKNGPEEIHNDLVEKLKEARSKARLISFFSKRDPDNKYAAEQAKIAVNKVNILQKSLQNSKESFSYLNNDI